MSIIRFDFFYLSFYLGFVCLGFLYFGYNILFLSSCFSFTIGSRGLNTKKEPLNLIESTLVIILWSEAFDNDFLISSSTFLLTYFYFFVGFY